MNLNSPHQIIPEEQYQEPPELSQEIGENDINEVETAKIQNCPKFSRFMHWCFSNGLKIHPALNIPAAFGALGVPGVSSKLDISANTVIAAIPNKLMITLKNVKESELSHIFKSKENELLFDETRAGDAEFNIIATFLIYEKLKGEKSFYFPYFEMIPRSFTMYDWTIEQVAQTESAELIEEFPHYLEDIEVTWQMLKKCLSKYPQIFNEQDLTKDIIVWSYELIMTRIFGYSLPCTCLVPFGDLFNHGNNSCTHYIVNRKFEGEEANIHKYKIKKHKIDLRVLDQSSGEEDIPSDQSTNIITEEQEQSQQIDEEQTEKNNEVIKTISKIKKPSCKSEKGNYQSRNKKLNEIKQKHKQYLEDSNSDKDNENGNSLRRTLQKEGEGLKNDFYSIRFKQLSSEKSQKELWEYNYYTTSNTEDNDTDDDQKQQRKKEYNSLFQQELKEVQQIKKSKADEILDKITFDEKRQRILQPIVIEETTNIEHNIQENDSQLKLKDKINEDERNEEKQKEGLDEITFSPTPKEEKQNEGQSDSSVSDDSDWSWYEEDDKDSYFAVTTEQPVYANRQIFLCYGRRTNKFLLQWYGFCYENNLFDSFSFRIWIKPEKVNFDEEGTEEDIICKRFISEEDWKKQYIIHRGSKVKTVDLSKEFKLKRNHLCDGKIQANLLVLIVIFIIELVVFLRILLSSHKEISDQLLFTLPRELKFEVEVFLFFKRILNYLIRQYSTTIEEDENTLKDIKIDYKLRFAITIRLDHKRLLKEQLEIVSQVLILLDNLKMLNSQAQKRLNDENQYESSQIPLNFREFYLTNFEGLNNSTTLLIQRLKIKNYLYHLNLGLERSEELKN